MQIDAHSLVIPDWDNQIIEMYAKCPKRKVPCVRLVRLMRGRACAFFIFFFYHDLWLFSFQLHAYNVHLHACTSIA